MNKHVLEVPTLMTFNTNAVGTEVSTCIYRTVFDVACDINLVMIYMMIGVTMCNF